ncbi:UNVERIFIED_CONTAM: hypothetical protein Slati_4435300 [Sesamum latifolium]|uniref:Uncharacterized protein n=1 Tax=Sesamum latifolium TaxID=2727402 RepID=A0AAW2ST32_9LAMI
MKGIKQRKKAASPEHFPQEGTKYASGSKGEVNDPPRKGVIYMIAGGPVGGDSHHARKSHIREAHNISLKEVLDVEAMEDAPLIQFGNAERSGSKTSHNDALVITALLANYEVGRIFINSGSSADILFGGGGIRPNAARRPPSGRSKYLPVWIRQGGIPSRMHDCASSDIGSKDYAKDLHVEIFCGGCTFRI